MSKIDFNSTENQRIKGNFVEREVYANVGEMVRYILEKSYEDSNAPFSYEDLYETGEKYGFDGKFMSFSYLTKDEKDDVVEELEQLVGFLEEKETVTIDDEAGFTYLIQGEYHSDQIDDIKDEIGTVEYLDSDEFEVYEWWIVSRWLARKLQDKGEVILDDNIWGRQTTGQAILLDCVISEICNDLKLLK